MKKLSHYADLLNEIFWRRIGNSTESSVQSLAVFRIITGFFILFLYQPSYGWLSEVPKPFFNPPILSIAMLFETFPSRAVFLAIDFTLLLCVTCIILGIYTRIAVYVFIILGVFATNFQFSIGKIDHSILIFAVLGCLSMSDWGTLLALRPDKARSKSMNGQALALLAVLVCFGFFSAGFAKAYWWINMDFDKSGSAAWFYHCFHSLGRVHFLAPLVSEYFPFEGFKFVDYIASVFEMVPLLFLLYSRKSWHTWLLLACLFHLINTLVFNIIFTFNAIAYLAFIDYSGIYYRLSALRSTTRRVLKLAGVFVLCSAIVSRIYYILILLPSEVLLLPTYEMVGNLYVSIALWGGLVVTFIASLIFTKGSASVSASLEKSMLRN